LSASGSGVPFIVATRVVLTGHGGDEPGRVGHHPFDDVPSLRGVRRHAGLLRRLRLQEENPASLGVGQHLRGGHQLAPLGAEGTAEEVPQLCAELLVLHDLGEFGSSSNS
jgi:hypothetical protein